MRNRKNAEMSEGVSIIVLILLILAVVIGLTNPPEDKRSVPPTATIAVSGGGN